MANNKGLQPREPTLTVATGLKGVGKTYLTDKLIMCYLMGTSNPYDKRLNDAYVSMFLKSNPTKRRFPNGRSVLIFDVNLEDYWSKYDTLNFDCMESDFYKKTEQIRKFGEYSKKGHIMCRRIVGLTNKNRPMSKDQMRATAMDILGSTRNCLLLLDDTNYYFESVDYTNSPLAQKITTNRHSNLDIVMHMQGLRMSPMMFQNTDWIRFHKQSDSLDRYKNTIPEFDVAKITEIITNNRYQEGRIYTSLYMSLSKRKIYGIGQWGITPDEFRKAARVFLIGNKTYLKPTLDEIIADPKYKNLSKHDARETAINQWIERNKRILSV